MSSSITNATSISLLTGQVKDGYRALDAVIKNYKNLPSGASLENLLEVRKKISGAWKAADSAVDQIGNTPVISSRLNYWSIGDLVYHLKVKERVQKYLNAIDSEVHFQKTGSLFSLNDLTSKKEDASENTRQTLPALPEQEMTLIGREFIATPEDLSVPALEPKYALMGMPMQEMTPVTRYNNSQAASGPNVGQVQKSSTANATIQKEAAKAEDDIMRNINNFLNKK